jgi:hypothetical protein
MLFELTSNAQLRLELKSLRLYVATLSKDLQGWTFCACQAGGPDYSP